MFLRRIGFIFLVFLAGCQSNWAPVNDINRPEPKLSGEHVVQPGETLYSIGWRYNRDFKELAQANDIEPPYQIYVGQKISFAKKEPVAQQVHEQVPVTVTAPSKVVPVAPSPQTVQIAQGAWQWPVKGAIIGNFKHTKGIDIAGVEGEIIHAANSGQVVYSGTGLRGYGQLLIIKHNEQYLSAYAHNRKLLVKEGDSVKIGQPIAEMGDTDTNRVKLHFEIRHNGKPVDPLRYLPK
ncbi:MAG: peptidoglycan DD-metalloendopeptidase family protein [Gammaproteobacteria bacterium]|jgi:lipoprotein NlpD